MRGPAASRTRIPLLAAALALGAAVPACGPADSGSQSAPNRTAATEQGAMAHTDGWITLFDGTDLSAWRGYGRSDLPAGWRIEDGLLAFVPGGEGGDIITREQFGDFELELEWRVGPAGNSGIFYRAEETDDEIYNNAPEMQILDDAGHGDGRDSLTSAGALYALYPSPDGVVRPAGEWNEVRIIARGPRIEHWLNGRKVVEAEIGSADWERRIAASKFADLPGFGRAARGHLGLQDHGDRVWFRDIRVRRLAEGQGG